MPLGCRFARAGPILGRVVDVSQPPARKTSARRDARVRSYRLVRLWLGGWACAPHSLSVLVAREILARMTMACLVRVREYLRG